MCGAYRQTLPRDALARLFGADLLAEFGPGDYRPSAGIPVVRRRPDDGARTIELLSWGLVPRWAKDESFGRKCFNARGETVGEKPSFRDAFAKRRCLIPADSWDEWQKVEGEPRKRRYRFALPEGRPFAFAGLWEGWKRPDGTWLRSCCIVTTAAPPAFAAIHDRMPVALDGPALWDAWLDPDSDGDTLQSCLASAPAAPFQPSRVDAPATV